MRKIIDNALIVIVTFILTLLLNTGIDYFFTHKGKVSSSPPINKSSEIYFPLTITNYSSDTMNGLRVSIPAEILIEKILPSYPIDIVEKNSANKLLESKKIVISGIEPRSVLSLLIPLSSVSDHNKIEALNLTELRMSYENFSKVENPLKSSFFKGFQTAAIYAIFYALFLYYVTGKSEKLNKKIENLNNECVSCKQDAKDITQDAKDRSDEALKSLKRIQVVLLARISDYTKELSFWRDTIRKLLYENNTTENQGDVLIKTVSENLKTYSTLKGDLTHSFDSAQTLADMIIYREKSKKD